MSKQPSNVRPSGTGSDKAQAAIKSLLSYIPDMTYTDYIIIDRWHAMVRSQYDNI